MVIIFTLAGAFILSIVLIYMNQPVRLNLVDESGNPLSDSIIFTRRQFKDIQSFAKALNMDVEQYIIYSICKMVWIEAKRDGNTKCIKEIEAYMNKKFGELGLTDASKE